MATAVPPEEVLFRRRQAPRRSAEDDFYWADRFLPDEKLLPNSDLLKVLHTFAASYYSRTGREGGSWDFRTMDETALLALGILVEESVAQSLGKKGHMVFYENHPVTDESDDESSHRNTQSISRGSSIVSESVMEPAQKTQSNKRRKLTHESSITESPTMNPVAGRSRVDQHDSKVMTLPGQPKEQRYHRTYTFQACNPCRKKRIKCNRGDPNAPIDPPCMRCRDKNLKCEFSEIRGKRSIPMKDSLFDEDGEDGLSSAPNERAPTLETPAEEMHR